MRIIFPEELSVILAEWASSLFVASLTDSLSILIGDPFMVAVVDWVQSLKSWLMSITPTILSGMVLVGLVWGAIASTRQAPEETGDEPL